MYRFEVRLGIGLHQLAGRNAARIARCLLWAMVTGEDVTEQDIGRASIAEFAAAFDKALILLVASCPPPERGDDAEPTQPRDRTDWMEMWSIGRHDLRLSESELWELTPGMFHALCARLDGQREHAEYCAGLVASTVLNSQLDPEKTAPFEPALWTRKGAKAAEQRRAADQAAALSAKLKSLGDFLPVQVIRGG